MSSRHLTVSFALFLLAAACTGGPSGRPSSRGTPPSATSPGEAQGFAARAACLVNPTWLLRIRRGYSPERSADIQMLPKVPNFVGSGLPHVGPWDFTSHVPLFWYGPGHI